MIAAMKAWMRAEGISSTKRNNPWNLHQGAACGGDNDRGKFCPRHDLPGQIGVVNVAPGDKNVAVFDTLDHGVQASANNLIRLSGSGYGYDRVIKYARKGDAVNFLNALALSSWSAGRYGTKGGGQNKLILYYNALGYHADPMSWKLLGAGSQSGGDVIGGAGTGTPYSGNLGAWADIISFPKGHRITVADVDKMMNALDKAGYFDGDPIGSAIGRDVTHTILLSAVGKPWDKSLQDQLQAQFGLAAKQAGGPGDALAAVAGVIGKLSDPGMWVRVLALVAGGALVAYGGVNVYRATA